MDNRKYVILIAIAISAVSLFVVFTHMSATPYALISPPIYDDMVNYNPNAQHPTFTKYSDAMAWAHSHPGMHGIVGIIAKHANGQTFVEKYSTNARTVEGINCALQILFNSNNGAALNTNSSNSNCLGNGTSTQGGGGMVLTSSTHFNGFNVIGLINRTNTVANPLNGSDTVSRDATYGDICKCGGSVAGGRASSADGAISRQSNLPTGEGFPQVSTVAGTATYNQITVTSPAFSFGNTASGMTVTGVFLSNATSAKMSTFAENSFTGVTLGASDTLTITWTLTLS